MDIGQMFFLQGESRFREHITSKGEDLEKLVNAKSTGKGVMGHSTAMMHA